MVADLVASRAAGTPPRDGEWYNVPAPLNIQGVTATAGTDAGKEFCGHPSRAAALLLNKPGATIKRPAGSCSPAGLLLVKRKR